MVRLILWISFEKYFLCRFGSMVLIVWVLCMDRLCVVLEGMKCSFVVVVRMCLCVLGNIFFVLFRVCEMVVMDMLVVLVMLWIVVGMSCFVFCFVFVCLM